MKLTADEVARVLVATGWEGWEVVTMGAIIAAESGRDPLAVNPVKSADPRADRTADLGLAQLNTFWAQTYTQAAGITYPHIAPLFDPLDNLRLARTMFLAERKRAGWSAGYLLWTTYRGGKHKPFIAEAHRAALAAGVKLT